MRQTPLWYANEEQGHLEKFMKAGIKEPSCSEWASPSVIGLLDYVITYTSRIMTR